MADLAKAHVGQEFNPKASDWNSFVDAAVYVKQVQQGRTGGRAKQAMPENCCTVWVKNDSGTNLDRFAAVGITGVLQVPGSSSGLPDGPTTEFINKTVFKVDAPTDDDKGKWLVLGEPLGDGQIGWAYAAGVSVAIVNIGDTSDTMVDCVDNSFVPISGTSGYQILWAKGYENGTPVADSTGEQYVVIRIGGGGGGSLPTAQYQYQMYGMVSQNQAGFTFIQTHPM